MEWEKLFRKYIWNEQTTPYLTPVRDLTRRQADSEILFYCWFHAILLGMIAISRYVVVPTDAPLAFLIMAFPLFVPPFYSAYSRTTLQRSS